METAGRVVRVDLYALSDHLARLYESDGGLYRHVDNDRCVIRVVERGKATDVVELTDEALKEFIDDMEYQVEFSDEPYQRSYRSQCRRALRQVRA